jgi:hypothetical protein
MSEQRITPERVDWFFRYRSENSAWGIFHVCLDDGNWECGAAKQTLRPGTGSYLNGEWIPARYDLGRDEWADDLREAADWFDSLTPSERLKLKSLVDDDDLADEVLELEAEAEELRSEVDRLRRLALEACDIGLHGTLRFEDRCRLETVRKVAR